MRYCWPSSFLPFLVQSILLLAVLSGCGPDDNEDPQDEPGSYSASKNGTSKPNAVRIPGQTSKHRPCPKPDGVIPSFRMLGPESRFRFKRYDDFQGKHRILETNGGGVALFDFDRDGLLDAYLTNGCRLPLRLDDHSTPGELFRNLGAMKFEPVASDSRLMQFGHAHGCAVGDFDADGFDDLYVTAFGRNTLWQNNGDGTFTDITESTGTAVPQWSSSAAFADLNGDGHLDLYVVNYLVESDESPKLCPDKRNPDGYSGCSPAMFEGVDDVLFISDGSGRLIDCTKACGIADRNGKGLGVVIMDLDGDLKPEIYVANDGQANFLFTLPEEEPRLAKAPGLNDVPRFEDCALGSAVALNETGHAQASMGIAAGDCDRNGFPDLFLTHFYGDTNTLYLNQGKLAFEDATRGSRLGTTSRQSLGFGTSFIDCDNNGWLDIVATNGHVDDRTWQDGGEPYRMRPQLYRNARNGKFEETSEWSGEFFRKTWIGRGLATGDLDLDGRIDAIVCHQQDSSVVIRNESAGGNSIILRLVGTRSNRNGIGARVEIVSPNSQPLQRQLVGGGGFQSASALEVHVGIGQSSRQQIRIHWPSGGVDTHSNVDAGIWRAVEGQNAVREKRAHGLVH
jgi:enediyne biosynthesis protein E4